MDPIIPSFIQEEIISFLENLYEKVPSRLYPQVQEFISQEMDRYNQNSSNDEQPTEEEIEEISKNEFMESIIQELRKKLPAQALAPDEKIMIPTHIPKFRDYTLQNTLHVDSFLYPDDDIIDELCKSGELSRSYCLECGSKRTEELYFVSHSLSLKQIKFIYSSLGDIKSQILVDIGSRTGATLYLGSLYTSANQLIGIEKSKFFCDIQNEMISKYHLNKRVKVICDDILNQGSILASADIIIMHNVFEFFASLEEQQKLWKFIRSSITKKKCKLVTSPSLEESLKNSKLKIKLSNWVKKLPLDFPETEDEEELEDYQSIYLYEIIG